MTFRPLLAAAGLALIVAQTGCGINEVPAVASPVQEPAAKTVEKPKADDTAKSDEPKLSATKLIEKGLTSARLGEMAKALDLFEQAAKAEPENRNARFLVGAAAQDLASQAKDDAGRRTYYHRSADALRKLRDMFKDLNPQEKGLLSVALYNEACSFAAEKKDDPAIKTLTEAVDAGFDDSGTMASDKDLASIREKPEYKALVARVKAAQVARVQAELKNFKSFPFTFELPGLDGKPVKLADFKGKVTIVDVWGTWCPPCRMEIPHFVDLLKKHKDEGLAIVGINYENGPKSGHKKLIESFIKENGVNYPCVLGDEKTQESIPDLQGFPTTLFIDREGKVRLMLVGYTPMPQLEAIVTQLLAEAPAKTKAP